MRSFENIEIAVVALPDCTDVLERMRRDEPCRANPLSGFCPFASARDDYLLGDMAGNVVCQRCPRFAAKRQEMVAEWERWILAMQEVYT